MLHTFAPRPGAHCEAFLQSLESSSSTLVKHFLWVYGRHEEDFMQKVPVRHLYRSRT
jgi:hypothetical protein